MKPTTQLRLATLVLAWALATPAAMAQETPPVDVGQLAQDALNQLQQTGNNSLLATWSQVREVIGGLQLWSADAINDINALAQQAGVALDAFVPSVQGCIRDTAGEPVVGAPVLGLTLIGPGVPDAGFQIAATTSGQAAPATFGAIGGPPIPVNTAWLSAAQNANWGPGCYWMPAMPSATALVAQALVSSLGSPTDIQFIRVIPVIPGYAVEPGSKEVFIADGNYRVRDYDTSVFVQSGISDSGPAD